MRARATQDGLTAQATAGCHGVLLGWDMAEATLKQQQVLGFGVRRTRHADGQVKWLPSFKTFKSVLPHPAPGVPVSSLRHPVQSFQWADHGAEPGQHYTYRVQALCAPAAQLRRGPAVDLEVTTEPVDQGRHAVFFNRGAIASQEYARRFTNRPPAEVGPAAYQWLSRGLVESLEAFIGQAGAGDALHAAFFEFKAARIHRALKAAKARGAKVKVLYDGDSQRQANEAALAGSGLKAQTQARTRSGRYAHNKFIVWLQAGTPRQVWTGSTNLSDNGLYGHSNNAHWLRDDTIAAQYEAAWQVLRQDLPNKPTAQALAALGPVPPQPWAQDVLAVFSPQPTLAPLEWYAALAGGAGRATAPPLMATFAFGMNHRLAQVYARPDGVLRFALMEKKGNGAQYKAQAAEVGRIRRLPNVTVAVGHRVTLNAFDRWLAETAQAVAEAHVMYVHTKYMLIDPLGADPVVVVGSANFSDASTTTNDENMLVIRGSTAVADMYLVEYMRLFAHYAFRESLSFKGALAPGQAEVRKHLLETTAWVDGPDGPASGYYRAGADRALRRVYFSGGCAAG